MTTNFCEIEPLCQDGWAEGSAFVSASTGDSRALTMARFKPTCSLAMPLGELDSAEPPDTRKDQRDLRPLQADSESANGHL